MTKYWIGRKFATFREKKTQKNIFFVLKEENTMCPKVWKAIKLCHTGSNSILAAHTKIIIIMTQKKLVKFAKFSRKIRKNLFSLCLMLYPVWKAIELCHTGSNSVIVKHINKIFLIMTKINRFQNEILRGNISAKKYVFMCVISRKDYVWKAIELCHTAGSIPIPILQSLNKLYFLLVFLVQYMYNTWYVYLHRVVCPNFGYPTITSSSTKHTFLQVKHGFATTVNKISV